MQANLDLWLSTARRLHALQVRRRCAQTVHPKRESLHGRAPELESVPGGLPVDTIERGEGEARSAVGSITMNSTELVESGCVN